MKITAILLLLFGIVWAQDPPTQPPTTPPETSPAVTAAAPEMTQREAPITFSTRVNLVMVPVIVLDKKGKAIGNLYKEDFQITDKGKAQTIVRFDVEKMADRAAHASAQARAAAEDANDAVDLIPTRFIAYFFDDTHLAPGDLAQTREAAKKHLATSVKATDRVGVFTSSGKVALDFTGDHAAIEEALNRITPQLAAALRDCPPMTYYQADLVMHNAPDAIAAGIADAGVCARLTGLFASAASQFVQDAAQQAISRAEQDYQQTFGSIMKLIARMATSPGERLVVFVSPGFYITNDFRFLESDAIDRAIRSKVTIGTLDARGLYTQIAGGDASAGGTISAATLMVKDRFERQDQLASGDLLAEFAEGTGGTWFHNDNGLKEGFDKIAELPEYEYSIGFSPQNLKYDGSFHQLKVTVRGKDYTVQARRGYYAPKRETSEAEQAQSEIREAFFSREEVADVPIAFQTQFFKVDANTARVSVLAKIELKQMNFHKQEGRNLNTITIVTGIFDTNGNLVKGIVKTVDLKLKDDNLEAKLASGLSAKTSFDLPAGKYVLRLVVRDSEDQMMSARNGLVNIP